MKRVHPPPKTAELLLRFLCNHAHPEALLADLAEMYDEKVQTNNRINASVWYWKQIIFLLPSSCRNMIYWSALMLRSYLLIGLRTIKKNKIYSSINILGLAIGIACCLLAFAFVGDELSYDRFHDDVNRIYEIRGTILNSEF